MQNNHIYLKEEVFSIENTSSLSLDGTNIFAVIREAQSENVFYVSDTGDYKCLAVETRYSSQ